MMSNFSIRRPPTACMSFPPAAASSRSRNAGSCRAAVRSAVGRPATSRYTGLARNGLSVHSKPRSTPIGRTAVWPVTARPSAGGLNVVEDRPVVLVATR